MVYQNRNAYNYVIPGGKSVESVYRNYAILSGEGVEAGRKADALTPPGLRGGVTGSVASC